MKHYSIFCISFQKKPAEKLFNGERKTLQKNIKMEMETSCSYTLELSLRINLHCLIIIIVHI